MGETSLLPLYTAIIGGSIAIAGGVVTHYLTNKRERTKLLIDKLEQAYLIVDSLGDWIGEQQAMLLGYKTEKTTDDPLAKVILYLQVYLKNCSSLINSLEQHHSEVLNIIFEIAANPGTAKERIVEFTEKRDDLMNLRDQALSEIRKKISSLL
jgi:hypothetical protein